MFCVQVHGCQFNRKTGCCQTFNNAKYLPGPFSRDKIWSDKYDHMVKTLSATIFKAKCLQVMEEVQLYKNEVTITKHGKPVAKLVPVKGKKIDPIFGCMKGRCKIVGDIISPIDVEWNAEKGLL